MIAVAVVIAAVAGPAVAQDLHARCAALGHRSRPRHRTGHSPLAEYRTNFADTAIDDVMFRVEADGALPDRIRIATLTWYDGEIYRALDPESSLADARFTGFPRRSMPAQATARPHVSPSTRCAESGSPPSGG